MALTLMEVILPMFSRDMYNLDNVVQLGLFSFFFFFFTISLFCLHFPPLASKRSKLIKSFDVLG